MNKPEWKKKVEKRESNQCDHQERMLRLAKECTTQPNGVKPEQVAVLERRRLGFSVKIKVEDKVLDKGHLHSNFQPRVPTWP
jgi:hypothetical protein